MSFGFGIGDFIAIGNLAWKLYKDPYSVFRKAPKEIELIKDELSNLNNTIRVLRDDVETPSSVIRMAGPERAQLVNDAMKQVEGTLLRL